MPASNKEKIDLGLSVQSYSVQSRDVPSPPQMTGLVTLSRKGCSAAHTVEGHDLPPQESVLVPAGPETDFRAACVVLMIAAVPDNTLNVRYCLFISWPWYVPQTLPSSSQSVCQADFCVPIHQERAEKVVLVHPFCGAGCSCSRLMSEATLAEELMKTGRTRRTRRNASAALTPMLFCRCLGIRNLRR